jgi:hypothetical protein
VYITVLSLAFSCSPQLTAGRRDGRPRVFDQIERLAKDPQARVAMPPMLKRMNLNLWLRFVEGEKGNRAVRRLAGGLITSDDDRLPVQPYGGTGYDENDGDRPALVGAAAGTLPAAGDETETSSASVSQQEDVSLSKVHRGDKS